MQVSIIFRELILQVHSVVELPVWFFKCKQQGCKYISSLFFFSLSLAIWCLVCFIPTLITFHIHYLNYRDRLHLYYNKLRLTFVSVVALCLLVGFLVGK